MEQDKRRILGDKFPKLTDKSKHKDWSEAWKREVLSLLPTASSILDLKAYGYKEVSSYPTRGSIMDFFPRGDDPLGETDNDGPAVHGMQSSSSETASSSEQSSSAFR